MGKTRDLFKKIGDTQGPFYAKTGTIKHRNGRNLMKQKRLRRGGKNTQELYKKGPNDPDNHDGVATHESHTSWSVKSSGPQEASLLTKLVEMMEFQLSDFKS